MIGRPSTGAGVAPTCPPGGWARRHRAALMLVSLALGLSGCAASSPKPCEGQTEATAGPGQAHDGWSQLSYEDKHARMTFVVHPALARRFKAAAGQKTAMLTCKSCHGERAEQVRYRMPAIEALKPSRVAALYEEGAELSPLLKFMRDEVTPTTARLMQLPVYDPKTQQGFGCFNCHLREREP